MKQTFKPLLTLITIVAVILLLRAGALGFISSAVNFIFRPVSSALYNLGVTANPTFTTTDNYEELGKLRKENAKLKQLAEENKALRRQLELPESKKYSSVNADVVGRQINSLRREVLINRGAKSGIQEGMLVTSQGYLIGKILSVADTNARVQLVNDTQFRAVAVVGKDEIVGGVKGKLGGVQIDTIPKTANVKEGSLAKTSDIGGQVFGIPIGEVITISPDESDIFYKLQVKSPVNFDTVRIVEVIIP